MPRRSLPRRRHITTRASRIACPQATFRVWSCATRRGRSPERGTPTLKSRAERGTHPPPFTVRRLAPRLVASRVAESPSDLYRNSLPTVHIPAEPFLAVATVPARGELGAGKARGLLCRRRLRSPAAALPQDMAPKENAHAVFAPPQEERVLRPLRAACPERRRGGGGARQALWRLHRGREQGARHPRDRALRGQAQSRDRPPSQRDLRHAARSRGHRRARKQGRRHHRRLL